MVLLLVLLVLVVVLLLVLVLVLQLRSRCWRNAVAVCSLGNHAKNMIAN